MRSNGCASTVWRRRTNSCRRVSARSPHGAAQTAIAQFDDVVLDTHDKFAVNPHVAKFVDDHRNALVVVLGENAVRQGRFATAQNPTSRVTGTGRPSPAGMCPWSRTSAQ